ncbi:MAG: hypothetical protein E7498_07820 [Ruminococcus sp.]|nr:hypothetical protein [Ruminococcus sp.]MBQ7028399.1 hypothetical protein [Ruminococcus sp.]MBQ8582759.1 hypothetical protein [Ruminococcus sp.]
MKNIVKIPVILASAVILTGCGSSHRLHDTSYLRAVTIDGMDEKTLSFAFFTSNDSVVVSDGNDIESAKRSAEISGGKLIFTGYTELVILGDCNIHETLGILLNEWKVPPSCRIVLGGSSPELTEKDNPEKLIGSVERAIEQGKAPECDIITVLEQLLEDGNAQLPDIRTLDDEK